MHHLVLIENDRRVIREGGWRFGEAVYIALHQNRLDSGTVAAGARIDPAFQGRHQSLAAPSTPYQHHSDWVMGRLHARPL